MADAEKAQPQSGIRQTVYKQPAGKVPTEATEVVGTEVPAIEAQTVIVKRGSAGRVAAERVSLEQSAAKRIEAKSVQADQAGIMSIEGERVVLQHSGASRIKTNELRMVRSRAVLVRTEQAHLENARAVLLVGKAEGDARIAFTVPSAALFGAALGAGLAVAGGLLKLLFGRGAR